MKLKVIVASLFAVGCSIPSAGAEDLVRGGVHVLPQCPGDKVTRASGDPEFAGLLVGVIAPLITSGVNTLLKKAGQSLTEAAQEQTVDRLHQGSYFYNWQLDPDTDDEKFLMNFGCVVVATRGTQNGRSSLKSLASGYKSIQTTLSGEGNSSSLKASEEALANELANLLGRTDPAIEDTRMPNPAVIGVFDVELSRQGTSFRLLPRFIAMDHSLRERRKSDTKRSFTFEAEFSAPGADTPFATVVAKIDGVSRNNSFDQAQLIKDYDSVGALSFSGQVTQWMPIVALDQSVRDQLARVSQADDQLKMLAETASKARALALASEFDSVAEVFDGFEESAPLDEGCPPAEAAKTAVDKIILPQISTENKKGKDADKLVIDAWTQAQIFFDTCRSIELEKGDQAKIKFRIGDRARTFDLQILIKEFRDRPVARFFGELLSDDDTRQGIASAITSRINPAELQEAAEEETNQTQMLRVSLETALLAVRRQEIELSALPAGSNELRIKELEVQAAKTSANRVANELGQGLPYPSEGLFVR